MPAAVDLDLRLPVLVEAGSVREAAGQALFAMQAAARDWVWLELGDDYARFIGDAR